MQRLAFNAALVGFATLDGVLGDHAVFDASTFTGELRGQDYEKLSRSQKQDIIWHRITEDQTSGPWNSEELLTLNFWEVFADYGDEIPCLPQNCRIKATANVGMHAKVKLVRNKQNKQYDYGMLKGADTGIMRIGPRFEPLEGGLTNHWGSVAIKLLRNGELSANILAQSRIIDADNSNHMGKTYATTVNSGNVTPDKWCGFASLDPVSRVSDYGVSQSITTLFKYNQSGAEEQYYDFPFKLVLQPRDFDFPTDSLTPPFTEYMKDIAAGTTLFDVYAVEEHTQDVTGLEPLATIESTSEFVTSYWGDTSLFFRHYRFEEQIAVKPEHENKGNYIGVFETPDFVKQVVAGLPTSQCPFTALFQSMGFPIAP